MKDLQGIERAQKRIVETSRKMLGGEVSYIEGSRQLLGLRGDADIGFRDPDFLPFEVIASETDSLPSPDVRKYWQPAALAKLQPEIGRAETWARETGQAALERLLARFSN